MKMQMARDYVLVSRSGPSVQFLKDTPAFVPPRLVSEVLAAGGVMVGTDKVAEDALLAELAATKKVQDERASKIEVGVRALLVRNQRGDFTGQGRPNLKILLIETGLEVTPEELGPIWEKVKAEVQ